MGTYFDANSLANIFQYSKYLLHLRNSGKIWALASEKVKALSF